MKKGFTLVELIAVILILGIIAVITTVSVMGLFKKSTGSLYDTQVEIIESAAKKWIIANSGLLPSDGTNYTLQLTQLVSDGYLDDGDVIDPNTKKAINGYVNVYFDNGTNQYKAKMVNLDSTGRAKNVIIASSNVVTSGDGLYEDTNEAGRYYFKGTNPKNYITFNSEQWRIISIESDGRIKLIKQTGFTHAFDLAGSRNASNGNTACIQTSGCPIWASNRSDVVDDSNLYTYLNDEYYATLNKKARRNVVTGSWCYKYLSTGGSTASDFIEDQFYSFCETEFVNAYVGTINVKEIREASNGTCGYLKTCQNNYLNNGTNYWTLNYTKTPLFFQSNGSVSTTAANNTAIYVRPSVYLDGNIELTGTGTSSDPYKIK